MKNRPSFITVACALLALLLLPLASSGPVSEKDITYQLTFPQMPGGDWRLSLVSLGEFERDGWNFSNFSIPQQYITHKSQCGTADTFFEEIYEMSAEEQLHKGCVINGTYQTRFCTRPTTKNPACEQLAPFKIDYTNQLTFDAYYNSYMWDIGRASQYAHYAAASCDITNSSCDLVVRYDQQPYNPFVLILEKRNSTDVYISEPTTLDTSLFSDPAYACDDGDCDVHRDIQYQADTTLRSPSKLEITLTPVGEQTYIHIQDQNIWQKMIAWFANLL